MKSFIVFILLFLNITLCAQLIKVYDDFHYIPLVDSMNGYLVYNTNTIISEIIDNGKLVHIEGDLINSVIKIDTSFFSIGIIENGMKKNFTLDLDTIKVYDNSFMENDTLFQLIDKDFHFSMDNGYKVHIRYTNNKLSFIKIFEDRYIVDYSYVKSENIERFFDVIQYNKEVIFNNKKD
jgi:hypothetical protein